MQILNRVCCSRHSPRIHLTLKMQLCEAANWIVERNGGNSHARLDLGEDRNDFIMCEVEGFIAIPRGSGTCGNDTLLSLRYSLQNQLLSLMSQPAVDDYSYAATVSTLFSLRPLQSPSFRFTTYPPSTPSVTHESHYKALALFEGARGIRETAGPLRECSRA